MPQNQQMFTGSRTPSTGAVATIASLQGLLWPAPRLNTRTLFVDADNGNDTSGRGTPQSPYATISKAVSVASAGTSIIVGPGTYDENVVVDVDYISMIGIQTGYGRPDVAPAAGVALAVTEGQGFYCRGMRFVSEDSDSVQQNANGFEYDDCVFDGSAGQAATESCIRFVGAGNDSYTASEGVVQNSLIRGSISGAGLIVQHALAAAGGTGCSDVRILNNRFYGNAVDMLSAVNSTGGGAGIFLNWTIAGNFFQTTGAAFVYGNMDQGAAGDLAANSALICGNTFADAALIAAQFDISGQPKVIFAGNYDAAGLVDGSAFNS